MEGLTKLLVVGDVDIGWAGPDGWTPRYTAERYGFNEMEEMLKKVGATSLSTAKLQRPSEWHQQDRFPGLILGLDGTTLSTAGEWFVIAYN